ncbi:MAG: DUF2442 domain-containing protein [Nitrosomonas sp.]|jgi:hypothetical protein|uniref:DUF2442 domain-containing protein n=1 Tax=Nitrosomonas sp. TaxID=42353 RepID=UPI001DD1EC13|nr:DUF2442 domain-containing protein [Nitrosomonas sp.]MBX9894140.1 DUF2442 domain-containing protein [Nitrosomonas sp.]
MYGMPTPEIEVSGISSKGFWMLLGDEELFVPFSDFPWFKQATIEAITIVEMTSPDHLYWPLLDIDLSIAAIRGSSAFPLVFRLISR